MQQPQRAGTTVNIIMTLMLFTASVAIRGCARDCCPGSVHLMRLRAVDALVDWRCCVRGPVASTVNGMGLLFALRPPQPRPKSLRRATRAQRREHRRAEAEEWAVMEERGWLLDVSVEDLLSLVNRAGGN